MSVDYGAAVAMPSGTPWAMHAMMARCGQEKPDALAQLWSAKILHM